MRYVLIDRILRLEPGRYLRGYKLVTWTDSVVIDYGRISVLPSSMLLETMAQAAGLLLASTLAGREQPVLAKVRPFTAHGYARPGDRIDVDVRLDELRDAGCRAQATATIEGRPLADATVFLARIALTDDAAATAQLLREGLADAFPEWFSGQASARDLQ
jgi:3-hydroxymyristoyl/3-hydroxydecanoyl-(acyl carrier protein) dehydratase